MGWGKEKRGSGRYKTSIIKIHCQPHENHLVQCHDYYVFGMASYRVIRIYDGVLRETMLLFLFNIQLFFFVSTFSEGAVIIFLTKDKWFGT